MLTYELTVDRHPDVQSGWMFGGLTRSRDADKIAAIEAQLRRWIARLGK